MEVKIISSNEIMCHVHSSPPSPHIGETLDGQSLITRRIRFSVQKNCHDPQNCHNLPLRSFIVAKELSESQAAAAIFSQQENAHH